MSMLSAGEAAHRCGPNVKPRDISDLLYDRRLSTDECPIAAGRRIIPESYLPTITKELRGAGKLPEMGEAVHA
jgi:hypothetical protein